MDPESSCRLTDDEREEVLKLFKACDVDNGGFIGVEELGRALEVCNVKLPGWQLRALEGERKAVDGKVSYVEFEEICGRLKANDAASAFKTVVTKAENLRQLRGSSDASNEDTKHSVRVEEQRAFSDWINSNLSGDEDLKHVLPIDSEGKELYEKIKDGVLLCKIINCFCPGTIDERAINKRNVILHTALENLTLALASSQAVGCNVINIDAHDLSKGTPHLVLGLLWQIIRIGLFNNIKLEHCPGLTVLLCDGEIAEDLLKLSPEAVLLRWVNHHLDKAGCQRKIGSFTSDITDSVIYAHLLKQIAPPEAEVTLAALKLDDPLQRAEATLEEAEKLDCRSFVTAKDITSGVYKLNLAFVANLFNKHPALEKVQDEERPHETREEKTYRNWINSMGVTPHVNWLYTDLCDGLVVLQLFDVIRPGIVNWTKVHRTFSKMGTFMEHLENCNYVVELGNQLKISLVGVAGHDISVGNVTLTLALIWQLMKAYTLSVLDKLAEHGEPIVEERLVQWANDKLAEKTTTVPNLHDPSLASGVAIIDLIDAIKPGVVNYDLVKIGGSPEDQLANAKYAISTARKVGAIVYALPEDIVEVKSKMLMTVFCSLMALDYVLKDEKDIQ